MIRWPDFAKCFSKQSWQRKLPVARMKHAEKQRAKLRKKGFVRRQLFEFKLIGRLFRAEATGRTRFAFWAIVFSVISFAVLGFVESTRGPASNTSLMRLIDRLLLQLGIADRNSLVYVVWLVAMVVPALPAAWLMCKWLDHRRIPFGFCRNCRYDLRGSDGAVCPECGTPRLPGKTS